MRKNIKTIVAATFALLLATATLAGCSDSTTNESSSATEKNFDSGKSITVVTREEGSGTRDAFIELTGVQTKDENGNKTDNTATSAVVSNSTEAVLTNISGNDYAIGYVSLGSLKDTVKAVTVDGVECNAENVKDGSYAIARPFNIATKGTVSEVAQDFISYILSADGQAVVDEEGYVSVADGEAFSGKSPKGKISIAGSSSVSPVMEKLKEAYLKINTNAEIEIQTSDSSSGMTAAMEGTCDIGMASRELKDEESRLTATQIAMDGIAVIVSNNNPADDLSVEEVKKIFTGEIEVWSDLD